MLQDVIDMQPSIVFLGNTDKSMLFANKIFLEFFDLDMFWLDCVFTGKNDSFVIQIKKDKHLTNFLVKTKHIQNTLVKMNLQL